MNGATRCRRTALRTTSRRTHKSRLRSHLFVVLVAAMAGVLPGRSSRADAEPNHVKDVKVLAEDATTAVEITGTTSATYNVRVDAGGDKLVVDLANAALAGAPSAVAPGGLVGGVLAQGFKTDAGTTARVTVNLVKHATFKVSRQGTTLRIVLTAGDKTKPDDTPIKVVPNEPVVTIIPSEAQMVKFERVPPLAPVDAQGAARPHDTTGCVTG